MTVTLIPNTRPKHKCAFEGCRATSEQPYTDGWANLGGWPGIREGFYCRAHADAIDAVNEQGGFDDLA